MPGETVICGELQTDLSVNVRGGLPSTAHDQWELQTVGGANLHWLSFHVSDTGAWAGLARETAAYITDKRVEIGFCYHHDYSRSQLIDRLPKCPVVLAVRLDMAQVETETLSNI